MLKSSLLCTHTKPRSIEWYYHVSCHHIISGRLRVSTWIPLNYRWHASSLFRTYWLQTNYSLTVAIKVANKDPLPIIDRSKLRTCVRYTGYSKCHDDVIKWKQFPRHLPFVRGIFRSPVNSTHKGQWREDLMFSLICAWINASVNSREAGDLRRHRDHYDVIVMQWWSSSVVLCRIFCKYLLSITTSPC